MILKSTWYVEHSSVYVTNLPKYPLQFKPAPEAQQRGTTRTHLGGSAVPPLPCLCSGTAKQEQEWVPHASVGVMPGSSGLQGERSSSQPSAGCGYLSSEQECCWTNTPLRSSHLCFFYFFFYCFFPLWVKQAQTLGQIHRQGKWK